MEYRLIKSQGVLNGIYKIGNTIDDRIYVGSAVGFRRRYANHLSSLRRNKHDNGRLQNFANKYGIDSLYFEIVEIVADRSQLISREQVCLDNLLPFFNICLVAGNTIGQKPWHGRKHKEETKLKISLTNIKTKALTKKPPKAKLTKQENIDRFASIAKLPERREASRQRMIGHTYWVGKKHSESTKLKMSGTGNGRAKKVMIDDTGQIFDTQLALATYLGVGCPAVQNALTRGNKCKGFKIKTVESNGL